MKKFLAATSAAFVALVGLAAPASADTVSLPYGGTATLTIPDVTMSPTGGCINHYGTFSTTTPDYWNIDITANGPTTWAPSDYLYGTGPQSRIVDLLLCPSFDGPGVYTASGLMTVEDPNSYDQREALVSDQFVVSHPAPPAPPAPPAQPAPPAVVYADVSGTVSKKALDSGVRFKFRSNAIPAGTTVRNTLKWKVTYDGRTKKVTQGPNDLDTMNLRFTRGRHVIKVFRNGTRVLTTVVKIRG